MSIKTFLLTAGALIPSAALAQAAPDDAKTSDQIACELSASCDLSASAEAEAQPAAAEPVATRSWSWGSRQQSAAAPAAETTARTGGYAAGSRADTNRKGRSNAYAASTSSAAKAALGKKPGQGGTRLAINFAPGSDQLTDSGRKQADQLFRAISAASLSGSHYLVAGHTELVGTADDSLDLSRRRAQVLVEYLVGKGVPRGNFRVRGYGADKPLPGFSASAQANRRVEIIKLN